MRSGGVGFLKEWLVYNLLGWGIGCVIAIFTIPLVKRIDEYTRIIPQLSPAKEAVIDTIIILVPLGIGLGMMQWMILRRSNIRVVPWILATLLGLVIPAAFLSAFFVRYYYLFGGSMGGIYGIIGDFYLPAEILIIGDSVGIFQAIILRKSISISALWIFANTLGALALFFLDGYTWEMGYRLGQRLEPFFSHVIFVSARGGSREVLLNNILYLYIPDIIAFLTAPFWASLVLGLPTGIIFSKFINNGKDDKIPDIEKSARHGDLNL